MISPYKLTIRLMFSVYRFCQRGGLLCLAFVGTLLLSSCAKETSKAEYTKLSGEVFHTYFSVQYDLPEDYSGAVDSTFHTFSRSLNPFDSTSLITAINRNESTHTDSMLREVFEQAMEISRKSQGSYDVTCAPLINLWGFGFEQKDSISPQVIDSILPFVGYQLVRLEGNELIKADPRMKIDFSSISKGYCSDLVGRVLLGKGAANYLVELGGEIAFRGTNPSGEGWVIGIDKPIDDVSGRISEFELRLRLPTTPGGLATSGNYRNYRVINGKKYAHTIDPRTGYPIQTDVLSATILAPSCMLADGLATACMTLSSKDVPAFIAHFPGVEYMLILGDGADRFRTIMSPGFQRLVLAE